MVLISYQIVFNKISDFKDKILLLLKESIEENFGPLDQKTLENSLDFKKEKETLNNRFILAFNVIFEETWENLEGIIKTFSEKLNQEEDISVAFKFFDEILLRNLKEFYQEVFEIEMNLREILTFIFVYRYGGDFANLLKEINVDLVMKGERSLEGDKYNLLELKRDESKKIKYFQTLLENEFFYLLFENYKKLNLLKNLQQNDLLEIAKTSDNFEDFKKNILERGIVEDKHKIFLQEIENCLGDLDIIRNCVAHNRTPSEEEIRNYEKSRDEIKLKIEQFWNSTKIVSATIYLEQVRENIGVYRQNSTLLEYVKGNQEEIDFGNFEEFFDYFDDPKPKEIFKNYLLEYLKEKKYNIQDLERGDIQVEFV